MERGEQIRSFQESHLRGQGQLRLEQHGGSCSMDLFEEGDESSLSSLSSASSSEGRSKWARLNKERSERIRSFLELQSQEQELLCCQLIDNLRSRRSQSSSSSASLRRLGLRTSASQAASSSQATSSSYFVNSNLPLSNRKKFKFKQPAVKSSKGKKADKSLKGKILFSLKKKKYPANSDRNFDVKQLDAESSKGKNVFSPKEKNSSKGKNFHLMNFSPENSDRNLDDEQPAEKSSKDKIVFSLKRKLLLRLLRRWLLWLFKKLRLPTL
jgi:hypothetical protein